MQKADGAPLPWHFVCRLRKTPDLDTRARLSGLTKQEYFLRRISERAVIVQPNPRVYKALRSQMTDILAELQRLETAGDTTDELLAVLRLVAETANGMKDE